MNVIEEIKPANMKKDVPQFSVGDTVRVHFRIVEGDKERVQIFEGVIIARNGNEGPMANFTVRRVAYNEGVERVFPLHSPRVEKVEVIREGHVRRAKLHYLRERSGKAARVRQRAAGSKSFVSNDIEVQVDVETPVEDVQPEEAAPVEETAAPAEETAAEETPATEAAEVEEQAATEETAAETEAPAEESTEESDDKE